jgi:hypothetical protein
VWTAAPEVNWITLTSSATGNGNGMVGFAVAPSREEVRRGSIAVANQRVAVTQASGAPPPPPPPPAPTPQPPPPAPSCVYTLARNSDFVGAADGAGGVSVFTTSTCRWTAVSNASWLFVSAGSSGTGNGFIEYRYLTNPGAQRSGTLTIAGLTFTVIQPAVR